MAAGNSLFARVMRNLRPSHQHSAYGATLLLISAVALSGIIGYIRNAYIAWAFGAGTMTDAYVAAFTLPDFVNYLLAGGTASITFISIYTRYTSQGRTPEAEKTFSAVITVMTLLLAAFIVVAEIFTTRFTALYFHDFSPQQIALCAFMTRVLLPGQLFFVIGGVVSAVLQSKRMFLVPALAPIVYNVGIIAGGVLLGHQLGISSLAWGALVGSFVGPFLINAIAATGTGLRYRPSLAVRDPGFVEWLRLSIPLMLGVSLVAADIWIMRHFAAGGRGDITRLEYAKRLMAVAIAVLGQATGQASLPFFARLFGEDRMKEFAATVTGAIFRVAGASLLFSSLMIAGALPLIDLAFRRGRFTFADSQETAVLFLWFSASLVFWAVQGLYARAFYAAGNTLTPMIAGTVITVVSLPMYWYLYHAIGVVGLAIASDIGIVVQTLTIAVLLHRTGWVRAGEMPWEEVGKAVAISVVAAAAGIAVGRSVPLEGRVKTDLAALFLIGVTWAGAVAAGLWLTKSKLVSALRRRAA